MKIVNRHRFPHFGEGDDTHYAVQILKKRGAWVAQSVERPTSTQVMISRLVGSSPTLGSVLTAQSLEPALDSGSPSFSAPPLLAPWLSLKNK